MSNHLIGRQNEQEKLQDFYDSNRPEFLALWKKKDWQNIFNKAIFFRKKLRIF